MAATKIVQIKRGYSLFMLRQMESDSVDAVVTDPPYGLKFMNSKWDIEVPNKHIWKEVLRVMKPGAHLLSFFGTRTYHRGVVAIEDAGFEIRDCIMWVYGSGFPKSQDISKRIDLEEKIRWSKVSKAIDKAAGAEREIIGKQMRPEGRQFTEGKSGFARGLVDITAPATPDAARWQGWGTALKPCHEDLVIARKPLDLCGLSAIMVHKLGGVICQLPLHAKDAEKNLRSSPSGSGEVSVSALWNAAEKCNTPEGLSALMDMSQSASEIPLSLNTGLSWLNTLAVILEHGKTFTTETASGLITDLKILNSFPSQTILEYIIEAATLKNGTGSSVSIVADIFKGIAAKLNYTIAPFVPDHVTSVDGMPNLHPNLEPIVLARKPFKGTVAGNVLEHGTGGLNVDGCRIEHHEECREMAPSQANIDCPSEKCKQAGRRNSTLELKPSGRWPANLCHDGSEEVVGMFPETGPSKSGGVAGWQKDGYVGGKYERIDRTGYDEPSGSAARFFYCGKASRSERDLGIGGITKTAGVGALRDGGQSSLPHCNNHPTVKPIKLMRWLVRLITPPGGLVLDPFMGSGSTGCAAVSEGFRFIGVERDDEYTELAKARIEYYLKKGKGEKK